MEDRPPSMSDNQRRFFCRVIFLLACVLPTATAIYVVAHQPTADQWAQKIQAELPIKVTVESVETPFPNRVVLRGLSVEPTETGWFSEFNGFATDEVILDFGFSHNEITFIHPIEIEMDSMATLLQRMMKELDDATWNADQWKLSFKKVALVDPIASHTNLLMKPVSITLQRGPANSSEAPSLQARLLARTNEESTSQLSVAFERSEQSNFLVVDAAQCWLPSNLLKRFVAGAPKFGANSYFQGRIQIETDSFDRTHGSVMGELQNVQLDQFRSRKYQLTGSCDIENLLCQIKNGRIHSAQLQIKSKNTITVDRSFLDQVQDLGVFFRSDTYTDKLAISKVAVGVTIQNGNLMLAGDRQDVDFEGQGSAVADCVAFKEIEGQLEPIAILRKSKEQIPLVAAAKAISGNHVDNAAIQFLDHFDIQRR